MKISGQVSVLELSGPDGAIYPALIRDGDELMLVDAAFPGMFEALEAAIRAEGFSAGDITHLLLTHQDLDHIGCINELKEACPSLQVLAHREEAPYIQGDLTPVKVARQEQGLSGMNEAQRAFFDGFRQAFAHRRTKIDRKLEDGERLELAGGIRVIHTPGHTPGHICLFVEECGLLIAGDSMNLSGGRLAPPNPQYTQDMDEARRSLGRLAHLAVGRVLCYHGGLVTEGDFAAQLTALSNM